MDEKTLQQKAILYQLLQNQLEQLKQQAALLEKTNIDLDQTEQAINELSGDSKKEKEMLIPLESGVYAYAAPSNTSDFLVDIGAGIVIKKDREGVAGMLAEKRKEIEKLTAQLQIQANETAERMNEIAQEVGEAQKE